MSDYEDALVMMMVVIIIELVLLFYSTDTFMNIFNSLHPYRKADLIKALVFFHLHSSSSLLLPDHVSFISEL